MRQRETERDRQTERERDSQRETELAKLNQLKNIAILDFYLIFQAGASAVLSYLFAGIAALFSALCYAEFGARVPKAGSAYSYTYVTIGEIWGFVIGWNIILEHMIGAAAVARAWSGAVDALFSGALR